MKLNHQLNKVMRKAYQNKNVSVDEEGESTQQPEGDIAALLRSNCIGAIEERSSSGIYSIS